MIKNEMRKKLEGLLAPLVSVQKLRKDSVLLKAYATFTAVQDEMTSAAGDNCISAYKRVQKKHQDMKTALLSGDGDRCPQEIFQRAMDAFRRIELEDFLRYIVPDLVADKKAIHLICQNHDNNVLWMTYQIIQSKQTYYKFSSQPKSEPVEEKRQLFSDASEPEEEHPVKSLYEQYCDLVPTNLRVSSNEFKDIYAATVLYKLDNTELFRRSKVNSNGNLKRLMALLLEKLEMTRPEAVEFCKRFFVDNRQASDQVRHRQLRNFIRNKDPQVQKPLMTEAIKLMAKMTPMDVLCQIAITKCGGGVHEEPVVPNDVTLENGLVYDLFLSSLPPCDALWDAAEEETVVVLFPTVFFVKKCTKDERLDKALSKRHLIFVFEDEALCSLLDYHYRAGFYEAEPKNMSFVTFETWKKESQGASGKQRILAFFTRAYLPQQNEIYELISKVQQQVEINALIASYEFESAKSPFANKLNDSRYHIHDIELIPQGIGNSTEPRRKMLLHITFDPADPAGQAETKQTAITAYTLNTDFKTQALSRTREKPVVVEQKSLDNLDRTTRQVYRDELLTRKASGRKKVAAFSHEFSPDLYIWCSKSYPKGNLGRPRLEAYFATPASIQKIKRGYSARDLAINETKKHTTRLS